MASACKGKGSVRTLERKKHLRPAGKRAQNKLVRQSGKTLAISARA
jgi:hypothetical protein